jgi:hypothetical protein
MAGPYWTTKQLKRQGWTKMLINHHLAGCHETYFTDYGGIGYRYPVDAVLAVVEADLDLALALSDNQGFKQAKAGGGQDRLAQVARPYRAPGAPHWPAARHAPEG